MNEFYKGYYLKPVRYQGDKSMFSRIVAWRAYLILELAAEFPTKRDLKNWIKSNPPSKFRSQQ
jgi:hypothetical protein